MTPEFSRPERLDTIGDQERGVAIAAEDGERQALARRFGLIAIARLTADFRIRREGGGVTATGRVIAAVTQSCAASGEPLAVAIDEAVALRFVDEAQVGDEEIELSADALDTMAIEQGAIDLGEVAAETVALALDPFARAPDADTTLKAAGVVAEDEVVTGAFAGLAGLKAALEGKA